MNKLRNAWKDQRIPTRQRSIVDKELSRMYRADVVPIFRVMAEAVCGTGLRDPEMIEVGCGGGHYYEVLSHFAGHPVHYRGIDYSEAMIRLAKKHYPQVSFFVGDAKQLPFADKTCDILISGTVLLHIPEYKEVIEESSRVARKWVIFHRTPVVQGQTIYYSKQAYTVPCVEINFGEEELLGLFRNSSLELKQTFEISEDIAPLSSMKRWYRSYLCKKTSK